MRRRNSEILARAVDASLRQRRVLMAVLLRSSRRTKEYTVDPLRLSYADGGIYLIAWVGEYGQVRTFSVERIRTLAVLDEHFEPRALPRSRSRTRWAYTLGTPECVEMEFDARVAEFVKGANGTDRRSSSSAPDGSLLMTLTVCDDRPLRSWIHSFGPVARVRSSGSTGAGNFRGDRGSPRPVHAGVDVQRAAYDCRRHRRPHRAGQPKGSSAAQGTEVARIVGSGARAEGRRDSSQPQPANRNGRSHGVLAGRLGRACTRPVGTRGMETLCTEPTPMRSAPTRPSSGVRGHASISP